MVRPHHPLSCTVRFKRLQDEVHLPERKSELASGMDVYAHLDAKVGIPPGKIWLVPTGFAMEIDPGYEAQIRPRSGMAINNSITVVNTPGTIDADYRGEVKVGLINLGDRTFILEPGTRIAQMVIAAVPRVAITEVDELTDTERGEGGFGSTGEG